MRLVTKAELARRAGVSKPAISRACKTGPLRVACQGDRVDLDHPAVAAAYPQALQAEIAKKGADSDGAASRVAKEPRRRVAAPPEPAAGKAKSTPAPDAAPTFEEGPDVDVEDELAEEINSLGSSASKEDLQRLRKALGPIIARFGTRRAFKDWLEALKSIEEIRKRRLDNEETEGRLISRELVKTHVFGAIEGSHRRLLGDMPKTVVRVVYAMAKSDEPIEVAEKRTRDIVTTVLKPVMATAERVVDNA
jgi:hypothetical protein